MDTSVVLRVSHAQLDLDACLTRLPRSKLIRVWRSGERHRRGVHDESGFAVDLGEGLAQGSGTPACCSFTACPRRPSGGPLAREAKLRREQEALIGISPHSAGASGRRRGLGRPCSVRVRSTAALCRRDEPA